ncbi:hypothetical protein LNTAR_06369 [Lentisphaera araneosa HTCC2155]|jgi:hypothetical protein|uniref:Uncharacterized protein n=1 Tax=Lentisphaera araneosa HTCC2155 TaxID=313628 RepID=A6DNA0_9BACT|nr:hypothetical protein [Lentisphaera araneosa]EDM25289.1 hypothetical protein LNTAR_24958 [Lentisphaera araneosa HTCC2155]EDM26848.1 hypothetical protein LNTAR_06369 [Lentisphaera araneosa HTCC2155]
MNEIKILRKKKLRIGYLFFSIIALLFLFIPLKILSEENIEEFHLGLLTFLFIWSLIPLGISYFSLSYAVLPFRIIEKENNLYKQSYFHHLIKPQLIGKPNLVYIINLNHYRKNHINIYPTLIISNTENKRYIIGSKESFLNLEETMESITKRFNSKTKIIKTIIG